MSGCKGSIQKYWEIEGGGSILDNPIASPLESVTSPPIPQYIYKKVEGGKIIYDVHCPYCRENTHTKELLNLSPLKE